MRRSRLFCAACVGGRPFAAGVNQQQAFAGAGSLEALLDGADAQPGVFERAAQAVGRHRVGLAAFFEPVGTEGDHQQVGGVVSDRAEGEQRPENLCLVRAGAGDASLTERGHDGARPSTDGTLPEH